MEAVAPSTAVQVGLCLHRPILLPSSLTIPGHLNWTYLRRERRLTMERFPPGRKVVETVVAVVCPLPFQVKGLRRPEQGFLCKERLIRLFDSDSCRFSTSGFHLDCPPARHAIADCRLPIAVVML